MATKTIAWGAGNGSITLDYTGQGNGTITVTSDGNNLYASRSKTITVSDGQTSQQVTINQQACTLAKGYLCFTAQEDGTFSFTRGVYYSLDDGETWTELAANTASPTVAANSRIMWKANISPASGTNVGTFSSTGNFIAQGTPMSLLYGDAFVGKTSLADKGFGFINMFRDCTTITDAENLYLPSLNVPDYCYGAMFYGCTALTKAPQLPATSIGIRSYAEMFYGCTSLVSAPALPAMEMWEYSYYRMFYGCTSLTEMPNLPATLLRNYCYNDMFRDCTSLTTVKKLVAMSLAPYCYSSMFYNCTSLVSVPSDMLPSTTLMQYCYSGMFRKCSSLLESPVLPAETLVLNCYDRMFQGCTSLTSIKALFTTTPSTDYTNLWVESISTVGYFFKSEDATWNVTGVNGVPSTWAIIQKRTLPVGYTQLMYIASTKTGGEYIDFNLLMWTESPLSYELDIACYPIGKGKDNHNQATFLSNLLESSNYPGFLIRINSDTKLVQNRNPNVTYSTSFNVNAFIKQSKGNGSAKDFTPDRGTNNVSLTMFCEKAANGTPQRFFEARVFYAKIKSNGDSWVRDCVPAKDSNNVLGLYDLANNVFYTTPQGEFVGGEEIT